MKPNQVGAAAPAAKTSRSDRVRLGLLFRIVPAACGIAALWGAARPGSLSFWYGVFWGFVALVGLALSAGIIALFEDWAGLNRELRRRSTHWWNLCLATLTLIGLFCGQSVSTRLFESDFVEFAEDVRASDVARSAWPIEIGPFDYDGVCIEADVVYLVGDGAFFNLRTVRVDAENSVTVIDLRGESPLNGALCDFAR